MNKWLFSLGGALVLAAIIVPVSIASFAPRSSDTYQPKPVVVMKEAIARGEAYKQVLEGDLLYVVNEQTNERSDSRKLYGQPHPAMERPTAKAAAAFGYLPNSGLIDPTSLGDTGIQPSIPYSYEATPGQSAMYIATLEADGWRIIGSYRTQSYLDYYLQKQDVVARVIVLQDSMKVFDNVKPELPDPKTFAAQEAP